MADSPTSAGVVLPEVKFAFESSATASTVWRVVRVHVREGMNEVYEGVVDVATEAVDVNPSPMMAAPCHLSFARDATVRHLCGIVRRIEDMGTTAGNRLVRVFVVPALWALSQRVNSRIYQNLNALDIVRDVFKRAGIYQDTLQDDTTVEYPVREYCVQYRESDLAFVMRLLEAEGVGFLFTHAEDVETLVWMDEVSTLGDVVGLDGEVFAVAGTEASTASVETVRRLDWAHETRPTGVTLRDFDFTRPAAVLDLTRSKPQPPGGMEVYEYPGFYTINEYDDGSHTYQNHDGRRLDTNRWQEHRTWEQLGRGLGNGTGFTPGQIFELTHHGREDLNQRYVVTRVEHVGLAPEELTNDTAHLRTGDDRYHNTFECVPESAPYRPRRVTPRPVIQGPQTATVVGPSGEEIEVDFHGRIKVQFHWDRVGEMNEKSSCWVRVAQTWAGPNWGFQFIPRIGMEVVVVFLEGDPDRPLVVGCVYNGANNHPYTLPEEKTKSTIKTNSSPTNGGYNELRFEDKAGHEEVFFHAQRDHNEVIERNHSETVKGNQSISVGGNQSMSVGGNQSISVEHDETIHVKGDQTITVEGDEAINVVGDQTIGVHGDEDFTVDGDQTMTVACDQDFTVGGDQTMTVTGDQDFTITGDKTATVTGDYDIAVTGDMTTGVTADYDITVGGDHTVGVSCDYDMAASGDMTLSSGTEVNISVGGASIVITSGKITISAPEIELNGGGATLKLHGSADLNGSTVNLNG